MPPSEFEFERPGVNDRRSRSENPLADRLVEQFLSNSRIGVALFGQEVCCRVTNWLLYWLPEWLKQGALACYLLRPSTL